MERVPWTTLLEHLIEAVAATAGSNSCRNTTHGTHISTSRHRNHCCDLFAIALEPVCEWQGLDSRRLFRRVKCVRKNTWQIIVSLAARDNIDIGELLCTTLDVGL